MEEEKNWKRVKDVEKKNEENKVMKTTVNEEITEFFNELNVFNIA